MKKVIFGGIAILGIAVAVAWNVNISSQNSDLSGMSLANIETLANAELFRNWKYSISTTTKTCTRWVVNQQTQKWYSITVTSNKISCPPGGITCTPFTPC